MSPSIFPRSTRGHHNRGHSPPPTYTYNGPDVPIVSGSQIAGLHRAVIHDKRHRRVVDRDLDVATEMNKGWSSTARSGHRCNDSHNSKRTRINVRVSSRTA